MPSVISHAIVATAIGKVVQSRRAPWWYWALGAGLSMVPDLDVIGFGFGVGYGDLLGHRGLTHSLFFALALAALISVGLRRQDKIPSGRLFIFLFLAIASHGILDAMTNGGRGVAFLSPFSNERFFFPFRPIEVSPIGIGRFFSERGVSVLYNEFLWLWVPAAIIFATAWGVRLERDGPATAAEQARNLRGR